MTTSLTQKAKNVQLPAYRKIEIELPDPAIRVLEEMAIACEQPLEVLVRRMVYSIMECDLTGCGDLDDALAGYLCRRFGYDPMAWRKEAEA